MKNSVNSWIIILTNSRIIILMESIHRLSRVVALRGARGHPGGQSSLSPTLGSSHHRTILYLFLGKYSDCQTMSCWGKSSDHYTIIYWGKYSDLRKIYLWGRYSNHQTISFWGKYSDHRSILFRPLREMFLSLDNIILTFQENSLN